MQNEHKKEPAITGKVTCTLCGAFFGFMRADGSVPTFDSCPKVPAARIRDNQDVMGLVANGKYAEAGKLVKKLGLTPPCCPVEAMLAPKQPKPHNLTPGGALNSGSGHRKGSVPPDDNDDYFNTD